MKMKVKTPKVINKRGALWQAFRQSLVFTNDQLIPFIICCLGALTQVTDLLAIYFSFQTMTLINLYSPMFISLPAVSLCYKYDLNENLVRQKVSRFKESLEIDIDELRFNLTLGELNDVTPTAEQLVTDCAVANSSSLIFGEVNYVDCFNVAPVKVNLNAYRKCFTFFHGKESPFIYPKSIFYDEYFLTFIVNISITSHPYFQMIIHDTDTKVSLNYGSPEMITMDTNRFNDFVFTYYTEQIMGMEFPYSNCFLYHYKNGKTKHDTIKECIFNSIYADYRAFEDDILVQIPFEPDNVSFVRGIRATRYRSHCEIQYDKPECQTKSYQLVLLRSLNNSDYNLLHGPGLVQIMFGYPIGSQINVTMQPKQDTLEYSCYIASIINLWLEISVLGVVQFVFKQTRKMAMKYILK